jgi:hypothetical protein
MLQDMAVTGGYRRVRHLLVVSHHPYLEEKWGHSFHVANRKLNYVRRKDSSLSRIDDTLDSLAGAKWFPTQDLNCGYWQIVVYPDAKEKLVFSMYQGLWRFTVTPYGLPAACLNA